MNLVKFALERSMLMNLLTCLLLVVGIIKIIEMRREAFPSVDFNFVSIYTVYPGASPVEVELYVTNPIEKELISISGIDEVTSSSIEGVSLIVIKLDPDLRDERKNKSVNDIRRAVERAQDLPDDLPEQPRIAEAESGNMPVIEISLSGEVSYARMQQAAYELGRQLRDIPDVASVTKKGYREKEFWIEASPELMTRFNISFDQIATALDSRNLNLPGGSIITKEGEFLVRTIGEIKTAEDIASIVLRTSTSGVTVRIGDVAKVFDTFEEEKQVYRTGSQRSINLLVMKTADGDIISLVDRVKEITNQFLEQQGDGQLKVHFVNDLSDFVRNRLGVLLSNGTLGIVLVLLILVLLLSPRIAIVAALGMPIAFMGALALMGYTGMTINLITMFALVIVLGMLVDDAIIVAENIWQHYEEGASPWDAAINGTTEVFWPVTTTIMTTIAAFSPLLLVSGIFGKFIQQLPMVVIMALVMSLLEAMFVLPGHAYELIKHHKRPAPKEGKQRPKLFHRIVERYGLLLHSCLKFRWQFFGFFVLVLGGLTGWYTVTKMPTVLFPADGIEVFFVRADLPVDSSLKETSAKFQYLEERLRQIPNHELETYVTILGLQQDDPNDPLTQRGTHLGQISVYLSPETARQRTADEIIDSLRSDLQDLASIHGFEKLYFSRQRTGPPVGKPIAIRVRGDDLEKLNDISEQLEEKLREVEGVTDITANFRIGKSELRIIVDERAASRHLLSVAQIALHIRTAYEGRIATYVRSGDQRIAIRLRYPEAERGRVQSLENITIPNAANNMIPLSQVATIELDRGYNAIFHRDRMRTITVSANVDEQLTTSEFVNRAIEKDIDTMRAANPDLDIVAGGEWEDTQESMKSLQQSFLVAFLLIFIILAVQFNSLTQPLVIMIAIPFSLIGVIWAFYLHNLPLSFIGLVGAIGLSGVVVNDSIVLVDFTNNAMKQGMTGIQAAVHAGKRRFRAVWLTTLTTVLGLLPLVYGIGGMDKFLRPAAVALGYGLIFGTILVLFFVPAVYLMRLDIIRIFSGGVREEHNFDRK